MKQTRTNFMSRFVMLGVILLMVLVPIVSVQAAAPLIINYQGRITDSVGTPLSASPGYFKFAIVSRDGGTVYWVNNGAASPSIPPLPVQVTVTEGVFSVKLGDNLISNMNPLDQSVFDNEDIFLRVWFSPDDVATYERFEDDIQIVSAGFAIRAAVADSIVNNSVTSDVIANDTITNEDINSAAAISADKIDSTNLDADTLDGNDSSDFAASSHSHAADDIADGTIANVDISPTAAISATKINRAGLDADLLDGMDSASFAISAHTHDSASIVDGSITNADINVSAAISASKINRTGLDADLLDGFNSTDFSSSAHGHSYAGSATDGGAATNAVNAANAANAANVTCNGCVGTVEIANNSINGSKLAAGTVVIPSTAFRSANTTCSDTLTTTGRFHFTLGTICFALAGIELPDGVEIGSVTCYVMDTSTTDYIGEISLTSRAYTATGTTTFASIVNPTTASGDLGIQPFTLSAPADFPTGTTVDNANFVYFVRIKFNASAALDGTTGISGCKVDYI